MRRRCCYIIVTSKILLWYGFYILLCSTRCLTPAQGSEEESIRHMEESAVVERVEIDKNGGWF